MENVIFRREMHRDIGGKVEQLVILGGWVIWENLLLCKVYGVEGNDRNP